MFEDQKSCWFFVPFFPSYSLAEASPLPYGSGDAPDAPATNAINIIARINSRQYDNTRTTFI